jgi:hypothetical protein
MSVNIPVYVNGYRIGLARNEDGKGWVLIEHDNAWLPVLQKIVPSGSYLPEPRNNGVHLSYFHLDNLAAATHRVHKARGWWDRPHKRYEDLADDELLLLQVTKLAMVHSEVSEAVEALRTDAMDDKLPQFRAIDVELVDQLIRIMDFCGQYGTPIDEIWAAKEAYNSVRPDHDRENRWKKGGKKF